MSLPIFFTSAQTVLMREAAKQCVISEEQLEILYRAARRIVKKYGKQRRLFDASELVDEAWLYIIYHYQKRGYKPAVRLLYKVMLDYVWVRVFDGAPKRNHWKQQLSWEQSVLSIQSNHPDDRQAWLLSISDESKYNGGTSSTDVIDNKDFLEWITKGLTTHEAEIVWARLKESGPEKRWNVIACNLHMTVNAAKLTFSHAMKKLRKIKNLALD